MTHQEVSGDSVGEALRESTAIKNMMERKWLELKCPYLMLIHQCHCQCRERNEFGLSASASIRFMFAGKLLTTRIISSIIEIVVNTVCSEHYRFLLPFYCVHLVFLKTKIINVNMLRGWLIFLCLKNYIKQVIKHSNSDSNNHVVFWPYHDCSIPNIGSYHIKPHSSFIVLYFDFIICRMNGNTAATAAQVPGPVQVLDRDLDHDLAAEAEITSSKALLR